MTHEAEDDDPIVAEVRRIREEIFAEYNYDLNTLFEAMRRKTEEARMAGKTVVSFPPRRPAGWTDSEKKAS